MTKQSFFVLAFCALFTFAGCTDPKGPQPISGSVMVKNQPLDQGVISFFQDSAGPPTATALIADGTYDLPAAQGLTPGKYTVRLTSTEEFKITPEEYAAGKTAPPAKERLPAKYNVDSQEQVEVKPGRNRFDYRLEESPRS